MGYYPSILPSILSYIIVGQRILKPPLPLLTAQTAIRFSAIPAGTFSMVAF
jgi:hypothetical protein